MAHGGLKWKENNLCIVNLQYIFLSTQQYDIFT